MILHEIYFFHNSVGTNFFNQLGQNLKIATCYDDTCQIKDWSSYLYLVTSKDSMRSHSTSRLQVIRSWKITLLKKTDLCFSLLWSFTVTEYSTGVTMKIHFLANSLAFIFLMLTINSITASKYTANNHQSINEHQQISQGNTNIWNSPKGPYFRVFRTELSSYKAVAAM